VDTVLINKVSLIHVPNVRKIWSKAKIRQAIGKVDWDAETSNCYQKKMVKSMQVWVKLKVITRKRKKNETLYQLS